MKNKTPIYFLLLLAVVSIFCLIDVEAQSENPAWPMFHGSAQHGGQSPYNTSHIDGTILWTFETEDGIEAGPIIGADGTIYVASHDGYLYAINPDGSEKWRFMAGEPFWDSHYDGQYKSMMATPAIDDDGTIYVYSSDHQLIAVNSNGTEKWRYHIVWMPDFWSSPAIGVDGTIYIGSARDDETDFVAGLYAINPDGTLKWIHDEGTGVTTPPAIGSDGTIYIGAATPSQDKSIEDTGKILAISPNGVQQWRFDVELWVEGASSVGPDGTIYAPTKEGDVYAISSQGNEIWRFSTGDGVSASPAIGSDGTVYVGSWDSYFYAITPDGEQKWRYKTPDAYEGISSPAAIGSDGTIYVGSNSGMFYAFNPNGTVKWSLGPFGPVIAGPAIAEDGTVYFASWDRHLYAIGSSPEEPQNVTETVEFPELQSEETNTSVEAPPEPTTPPTLLSLPENVTVHFIDVGQGDAVYVDTPGLDMLVDGGSRGEGDTVVAYLRSLNVTRIDFVVATHPHADHIGGLIMVLTEYNETQIPVVIDSGLTSTSETYKDYVAAVGARNITLAVRGEAIDLEQGVEVLILNPAPDEHEDTNDNSVVLWLQVYNVTFLLSGDSEAPAEEGILAAGYGHNSTVLKVGHHGSRTSTRPEFLDVVDPEVAVISVGEGNQYDHPHNETLDKLSIRGVLVYRTDHHGTLTITTDGDDYTVHIEKGSVPLPPTPESEPEPEPSPEPEPELEQDGIPGFPYLGLVIGVILSLILLKKIHS